MNTKNFYIFALAVLITGCETYKSSNAVRMIPANVTISSDQILEAAIESAQGTALPPATKIDKANGVVEFGGFERPELGYSAQVRVRSDHQVEITVKRGSTWISRSGETDAEIFKTRLEERLAALEKAGK